MPKNKFESIILCSSPPRTRKMAAKKNNARLAQDDNVELLVVARRGYLNAEGGVEGIS